MSAVSASRSSFSVALDVSSSKHAFCQVSDGDLVLQPADQFRDQGVHPHERILVSRSTKLQDFGNERAQLIIVNTSDLSRCVDVSEPTDAELQPYSATM